MAHDHPLPSLSHSRHQPSRIASPPPSRPRVPRTLTPVGRVSHPPSPSRSFPPRSPRARRRRPRTRSTSVVCSHPRVSPRASRDTARDTRASRSTPWMDRRRVTGRPAGRRGDDGDGWGAVSRVVTRGMYMHQRGARGERPTHPRIVRSKRPCVVHFMMTCALAWAMDGYTRRRWSTGTPPGWTRRRRRGRRRARSRTD